MKCTKCNMEIAYSSYLDGFFCSCGFAQWIGDISNFFMGWLEHSRKIIEMRDKYQFKPSNNL